MVEVSLSDIFYSFIAKVVGSLCVFKLNAKGIVRKRELSIKKVKII